MPSCHAPAPKRRIFTDAGRACPIDYRIAADAFADNAQRACDVLYVVGGLYGNPFALDAVDALVATEQAAAPNAVIMTIFNGDMHWFDKTADNFANIEQRAACYDLLVGNVEAELRRQEDVGVGCGCAYPECTTDEAVGRSNRIHRMLSRAVDERSELKEMLQSRPSTATVEVGGCKVGITHGDEKLIGGWDCSREALQDVIRQDELDMFFERSGVDIFVTTHTCAPVALTLSHGAIINNGSAGLPNFEGQHFGLAVRIAKEPHADALFGVRWKGVHVQAIPVRYDHEAYVAWFDELWSETSPAAISYRDRIVDGADDRMADALLGGFALERTGCEEARAAQERHAAQGDAPAPATKRDVAKELAKLLYFEDMAADARFMETVDAPDTIQVNITAQCNLQCEHCHVEAGPHRREAASRAVLEAVLKVAADRDIGTIDITGGAPEMHPDFAWFLREAAHTVPHVMVRSNLTILGSSRYAALMDLYAELRVEVVGSVPNVFPAQADSQRGQHVFDASIDILRALNERGYGRDGAHILDLVFNPQQPVLPPEQAQLEEVYRRRLAAMGITFDNLFAVANNPLGRYGASLIDDGAFDAYLETLIDSFNPDTLPHMMCRHQLSVGWDGTVYDCDFNQACGIKAAAPVAASGAPDAPRTIMDYAVAPSLPLKRPIHFGNHCYACTAGSGSSCGGTLVQSV